MRVCVPVVLREVDSVTVVVVEVVERDALPLLVLSEEVVVDEEVVVAVARVARRAERRREDFSCILRVIKLSFFERVCWLLYRASG